MIIKCVAAERKVFVHGIGEFERGQEYTLDDNIAQDLVSNPKFFIPVEQKEIQEDNPEVEGE